MSTKGYSRISDDTREKPLPALTVFCYGVGHFLNDMTGACWFNYLLYYLITVRGFSTLHAALIMLSGQVTDGLFNPIVGYLSDKTKSKYGRRKTWVAIGAIIVSVTFYFVFSGCTKCQQFFRSEGTVWDVLYGAFLTGTFNIGWAAIQVSHLSFAPDITSIESERVRLYSARSAATIFASFCVLIIAGISFKIYGITENAFWLLSLMVIIIGDVFTLIFLIGVPEKDHSNYEYVSINENTGASVDGNNWSDWMKKPLFWQVGIIYTLTRVAINLSQIFMPFYIELFLGFGSGSEVIAIVPIVVMATGFITSFLLKKMNTKFGRRTSYFIGSICFLLGILVIFLLPQKPATHSVFQPWYLIYLVAFLFGIGQTTVLVTAISMEADLVGNDVKHSAFVYGFISCMEKLGTGSVIMSTSQYTKDLLTVRMVEIVAPFAALVVSGIVLLTIVKYWKKQ